MIKCSSDFVWCIMNAKFLNGHKDMQVQEGKYINRYEVLFTLAKEYTGCDTQEILLSIKKRMHQITDFFRIVEMKKDDLFGYKHLQSIHTGTQDKFMNIHKMQMQHVQSVEP